eukprot:gb/GECH01012185.1/.p1 GENE.gb/GECH01012185.1/~~gb/GECH01012185.1/.p1  ORF type:complete len:217 (+),score=32.22 gb/GECH01012185.1/:1-651(+)
MSTKTLFTLGILLGLFFLIFSYLDEIKHHNYIFDPQELQNIARSAIDKNHTTTHDLIHDIAHQLHHRHPQHIDLREHWVFNNAGGAMGQMWILHASITEYVIIFGSAIGTEGHTGRFLADDYFIIVEGEQWSYAPGQFDRYEFKPGDMHLLPRGQSEGYRMPDKCYALEYARGWIPAMLPFGFSDTFSSTLDFNTLSHTIYYTGRSVINNLLLGKF